MQRKKWIYEQILVLLARGMIYYCPDDDIIFHSVAEYSVMSYTGCKLSVVVQSVRQGCGDTPENTGLVW